MVFGSAPKQTVRYFPDKLPIGHAEYGRTHAFLYPVHAVDLVHFSLFLLRHQQRLHALPFWTIRVLLPRPLARHADSFRWATRAALATPLEPYLRTELQWYFEMTSRGTVDDWRRYADRMREARRAFRGPKFIALRRLWQTFGETELYGTTSRVLLTMRGMRTPLVKIGNAVAARGCRVRCSVSTKCVQTGRRVVP